MRPITVVTFDFSILAVCCQRPTGGRYLIRFVEDLLAQYGPQPLAAAYFFARGLSAKLKVPVGVIVSAIGGSAIESWENLTDCLAIPNCTFDLRLGSEDVGGLSAGC